MFDKYVVLKLERKDLKEEFVDLPTDQLKLNHFKIELNYLELADKIVFKITDVQEITLKEKQLPVNNIRPITEIDTDTTV